jgi:Co/Zn/Cd efflux system component
MHTDARRQKVLEIFRPGRGVVSMRATASTRANRVAVRRELRKNKRMLIIMMTMVGFFALVELVFGFISDSLALLSDAFHMLSDLISLIVGYVAIRLAERPSSQRNTCKLSIFNSESCL